MIYFVIAGKPDCGATMHAMFVGKYLEKHLPNFNLRMIQHQAGDWEPWLELTNFSNTWHHATSPLIWKELSMRGGIPHYIGGLSEFWEYCYDYYGLESKLTPEDLKNLVNDNMQYYREMQRLEAQKAKYIMHISIIGACSSILILLLPELLKLTDLQKSSGIQIKLFDYETQDAEKKGYLYDVIEGVETLTTNGAETVIVVDTIQKAVNGCELLIIVGGTVRSENQAEIVWLSRNMSDMFLLADQINMYGRRDLKIVVALNTLSCFNATILLDACTAIRIQNIVAVTSDIGLSPLNYVAQQTNVLLEEIAGPPVWGFVGCEDAEYVDIESALILKDMHCPYQRMLKNKGGSTLPLGTIHPELRYINYLLENVEEINKQVKLAKNDLESKLQRRPNYAKVRAITSLLKLWYAKEHTRNVISLGICSNDSNGIPAGIVFSQPAILEHNVWVPFKNFPTTVKTHKEIQKLVTSTMDIMNQFCKEPSFSDSLMSDIAI